MQYDTMNDAMVKEQVQSISQQERIGKSLSNKDFIPFINARQMLLEFFLIHMYSNRIEVFNERYEKDIIPFKNDETRMKYFIERFCWYYNLSKVYSNTDKPYPWTYPPDDLEHCEDYTAKDVTNDLIDDIKKSIHIIIGYYELTFHKRSFLGLPQ